MNYKLIVMKKSILMISALMMLMACGGQKNQAESADAADSTNVDSSAVSGEQTNNSEANQNELLFVPDLTSDKPLDLSDGKDEIAKLFPVWVESDVFQEDEEEGVCRYNLDLGYEFPLQQLLEELPGPPVNVQEVGRVILIDLNKDGDTDALVCLGRHGNDENLYFDAYLWDEDRFGGTFALVENFRDIPNPGIDKESSNFIGRKGADREVWSWKGKDVIEKLQVDKNYYK
jgi:hypothetical protein